MAFLDGNNWQGEVVKIMEADLRKFRSNEPVEGVRIDAITLIHTYLAQYLDIFLTVWI